ASNIEVMEMEKHLGIMGVIAGIAPMLGFIGTIAGVIKIFYDISVSNDISISIISAGLYEKMVTSGFGLLTGIIAYGGYHLLNMKIDRFALKMQRSAFEFIKIINKSE
ncbi:MAG: MotA/TolQ/ExbB proton channel family protein, partial [Fimbriimonadaceae bacterium]|nr:MotA/TolQ/ExbB proton channel family protein [Chitinophagales bacterium]